MRGKHILIAAGGSVKDYGEIRSRIAMLLPEEYITVGVDSGTAHLFHLGLHAEVAIGDFDSLSPSFFETASSSFRVGKTMKFSSEKDFSDTHLAVNYVLEAYQPDVVVLIGFSGSRLDHTFANIHLLRLLAEQGVRAYLLDEHNTIFMLLAGEECTLSPYPEGYYSFFPYGDSAVVTLQGAKYEMFHRTIKKGETLALSNEIRQEAQFHVYRGSVIVFRSRDE